MELRPSSARVGMVAILSGVLAAWIMGELLRGMPTWTLLLPAVYAGTMMREIYRSVQSHRIEGEALWEIGPFGRRAWPFDEARAEVKKDTLRVTGPAGRTTLELMEALTVDPDGFRDEAFRRFGLGVRPVRDTQLDWRAGAMMGVVALGATAVTAAAILGWPAVEWRLFGIATAVLGAITTPLAPHAIAEDTGFRWRGWGREEFAAWEDVMVERTKSGFIVRTPSRRHQMAAPSREFATALLMRAGSVR